MEPEIPIREDKEFIELITPEYAKELKHVYDAIKEFGFKSFFISYKEIGDLCGFIDMTLRSNSGYDKKQLRIWRDSCSHIYKNCNKDDLERNKLIKNLRLWEIKNTDVEKASRVKIKSNWTLEIILNSEDFTTTDALPLTIPFYNKKKERNRLGSVVENVVIKLIEYNYKLIGREDIEVKFNVELYKRPVIEISYKETQNEANRRESKSLKEERIKNVELWHNKITELNKKIKDRGQHEEYKSK